MKTRYLLPALLATSVPLFANGGGYLQGIKSTGPFRPINVDNVEMVSEKLDIELQQDAALVSIAYQLHNPGKAVKVEMGFPCAVAVELEYNEDATEKPIKALPQLEGFALAADGKPVESKLVRDHAKLPGAREEMEFGEPGSTVITGWQVVSIPFAAGQTVSVTVRYKNPYYREISSISDDTYTSAPMMRYLFSAAALWKGPIKSGEITVRATGLKAGDVTLSHPKRFQKEGNQWKWNFTDFEPTMQDDLEIVVGDASWEKENWSPDDAGGTYAVRGRFTKIDQLKKSGKWFFISRQYTATASSNLKPSGELTYEAANLTDPDPEKAWVEGAEGDGIGESVTLTMKKPAKASRILLSNGYTKSEETFARNNRVKRLSVSVNGAAPFSAEIPDGLNRECAIDLPPQAGPVETVKLTIAEVYPGSKFKDTCISDIAVEVPLAKAPAIQPAR
jgi:hypothetical protein